MMDAVSNSTVAVLLVGASFRSGKGHRNGKGDAGNQAEVTERDCSVHNVEQQREATASLLARIIYPLESIGCRVEVLATLPACSTMNVTSGYRRQELLDEWLSAAVVGNADRRRRVIFQPVLNYGVGHSWMNGYKMFSERGMLHAYDFVFTTRHDLIWKASEPTITEFPFVDLMKLTFPALGVRCNDDDDQRFSGLSTDALNRGKGQLILKMLEFPECAAETDDKYHWVPKNVLPHLARLLVHNYEHDEYHCMTQSPYTHNFAKSCFPPKTGYGRSACTDWQVKINAQAYWRGQCSFLQYDVYTQTAT